MGFPSASPGGHGDGSCASATLHVRSQEEPCQVGRTAGSKFPRGWPHLEGGLQRASPHLGRESPLWARRQALPATGPPRSSPRNSLHGTGHTGFNFQHK